MNYKSVIPLVALILLASLQWSGPNQAGQRAAADGAGKLEVLTSIELPSKVRWFFESDIGFLYVYGNDRLFIVDLLNGGKLVGDPVYLPGAKRPGDILHLSGTSVLLVPRAKTGLMAAGGKAEPNSRAGGGMKKKLLGSSYALNAFSGEILWEQEGLHWGSPSTHTKYFSYEEAYLFPQHDRLVFKSGGTGLYTEDTIKRRFDFHAIEISTGKTIWQDTVRAQTGWPDGSVFQVIGEETISYDVKTGERLRNIEWPGEKNVLIPLPAVERVMEWRTDRIATWSLPNLEVGQVTTSSPTATSGVKKIWELETGGKALRKCRKPEVPCGPLFVSQDSLLINFINKVELLDLHTGKLMWARQMEPLARPISVSRSGKHCVIPERKEFVLVDMLSGHDIARYPYPLKINPMTVKKKDPYTKDFEILMIDLFWISDTDFLVMPLDKKGRPLSAALFDIASRSPVWSHEIGKHPDYSTTPMQKLRVLDRLLHLAVAPPTIFTWYHPAIFSRKHSFLIPRWLLPDRQPSQSDGLSMGSLTEDLLSVGSVAKGAELARLRYKKRQELIKNAYGKELFFVAGNSGAYEIRLIDLKTGKFETVGVYPERKIHAIDIDPIHRIAITIEDNYKVLKVLALPERSE